MADRQPMVPTAGPDEDPVVPYPIATQFAAVQVALNTQVERMEEFMETVHKEREQRTSVILLAFGWGAVFGAGVNYLLCKLF